MRLPGPFLATSFDWQVTMVGGDRWCFEEGSCISVDPWLASSFLALIRLDEGRQVALVAAQKGVRIVRGTNELDVLARYAPGTGTIAMDSTLSSYSSWVRAAFLAHELQHAVDLTMGKPAETAACYRLETDAFRREARIWAQLWNGRLPSDVDAIHTELNKVTTMARKDPAGFETSIARLYGNLCGD